MNSDFNLSLFPSCAISYRLMSMLLLIILSSCSKKLEEDYARSAIAASIEEISLAKEIDFAYRMSNATRGLGSSQGQVDYKVIAKENSAKVTDVTILGMQANDNAAVVKASYQCAYPDGRVCRGATHRFRFVLYDSGWSLEGIE